MVDSLLNCPGSEQIDVFSSPSTKYLICLHKEEAAVQTSGYKIDFSICDS